MTAVASDSNTRPALAQEVLVVEDDADIRDALKEVLELEGYQVITANDGQQGLEALKKSNPCVILLDLMMPVMNGWQFLTELRKSPNQAKTPIIVITAADPRATEDIQAEQILQKPLELDMLLKAVGRFRQ